MDMPKSQPMVVGPQPLARLNHVELENLKEQF